MYQTLTRNTQLLHGPSPEHSNEATPQGRAARFTTTLSGNRYFELKAARLKLRESYIRQGLMDAPDAKRSLDDARNFVGTCVEMCSEFERHEREYEKTVDRYEMQSVDGGALRIDHTKAVKRYRRSAAGDDAPLPCDVRPPHVLLVYIHLALAPTDNAHAF